ncbi:MAG: hypothetical protein EOP45_02450 [Sphingobacteriaceae bacterium]|nr:MAG: hypothetical protein EOP45_02450 [Sphingobacteriaceae bacterium]
MGIYKIGDEPKLEMRRTALLAKLLNQYQPALVALQEAPIPQVVRLLQNQGYSTEASGLDRRLVTGWKNTVWGSSLTSPIDYSRALAVVLPLIAPSGRLQRVLVCNVHLPALAPHGSKDKTIDNLKTLRREIEGYRRTPGNEDVAEIILGDFNLEPHTPEICSGNELAGNRSLPYVQKREVERSKGDWYRPLYNPSWQLYGNTQPPHGTIYRTGGIDEPWYIFDQALFSGDLIEGIVEPKLIKKIGRISLLTTGVFMPDKAIGSDHLPLVWTLPINSAFMI